jgi:signal transduction histidine kinase/ligand-binding sensor domain-containing protein
MPAFAGMTAGGTYDFSGLSGRVPNKSEPPWSLLALLVPAPDEVYACYRPCLHETAIFAVPNDSSGFVCINYWSGKGLTRIRSFSSHANDGRWLAIGIAFLFAMVMAVSDAHGQAQERFGANFTQTVWLHSEHVPDDIHSMAQTPDGWIWLASRSGLYRFDGVSAERYDAALSDNSAVAVVYASDSGDLWLVYASGLSILLPAHDFAHPRVIDGIHGKTIKKLLRDKRGTMWALALNACFELSADGRRWMEVGEKGGLPGSYFYASDIDADGTIWILTDRGLFTRAANASTFAATNVDGIRPWSDVLKTMGNINLSVAYTIGKDYLAVVLEKSGRRGGPTYNESRMELTFDSTGRAWLYSQLAYYTARHLTPAELNGLVDDLVRGNEPDEKNWEKSPLDRPLAIMEDRQHNIWISTIAGLAKLHPNVATVVDLPPKIYAYAMQPGANGSIWFGNAVSKRMYRWWHIDQAVTPASGYDKDTTATYRDRDGSIWLGTGDGYAYRFNNGQFDPISPLPPGSASGDDILTIAKDGQQRPWMSIRGRPIYEWRNDQWLKNGGFSQLPESGALRAVPDAQGRLWISFPKQLFVIDGDHLTAYAQREGMDITNVRDIIPDGVPIVGGDDGLAVWKGGRFHRIAAIDPAALTDINGLVRLQDGTLWLNGHKGGVRISASEWQKGVADPNYKVSLRIFGMDEGMPGIAQPARPLPSLIQGTDGRLWFADSEGIAWIDPREIPREAAAPNPVIRSVTVGDQSYHPDASTALPAGSRQLQMDYTALGLSNASAARFRYRLEGLDRDWQDVGTRRQAYYTNLGPGTYRFRLEASNEDGVWGDREASLKISIEPFFYQTTWFLFASIVVGIVLLWLVYLYYLSRASRRLHQRLDERHAERDRIARELHDTFLQTLHVLVLKIHAASERLPESESRENIASALDFADHAIAEGRRRVSALRFASAHQLDLAAAFEKVASEYEGGEYPVLNVSATGTRKFSDPLIIDELRASGREAIINAFNHSAAKSINVRVHQDRGGIRIEVSDDGKGIDPQVILNGGSPGHWGLPGIRERMGRIGGELRIISNATHGTTVILSVDASRAYRRGLHKESLDS